MGHKKGAPLTEVACVGCGRTQRLRKRKIIPCDGYTCALDSCKINPSFSLPPVPEGCVRRIEFGTAGAFSGYSTRFATQEELEAIARARRIRDYALDHLTR